MRASTVITVLSLLVGADACWVRCTDGSVHDVGSNGPDVCSGQQKYVFASEGFADLVYFAGNRPHACVDYEGFSLEHIAEDIVTCQNFVRGTCCGHDRCSSHRIRDDPSGLYRS